MADSETFGWINEPFTPPTSCWKRIDFLRPDGDGIFSCEYDMNSDLPTINKNITDGYRIIRITE